MNLQQMLRPDRSYQAAVNPRGTLRQVNRTEMIVYKQVLGIFNCVSFQVGRGSNIRRENVKVEMFTFSRSVFDVFSDGVFLDGPSRSSGYTDSVY